MSNGNIEVHVHVYQVSETILTISALLMMMIMIMMMVVLVKQIMTTKINLRYCILIHLNFVSNKHQWYCISICV
jgi:hypothetical protein